MVYKSEHDVPALLENDILTEAAEIKTRRDREEAILKAAESIRAERDKHVDKEEHERAVKLEEDKAKAFTNTGSTVDQEKAKDNQPERKPEVKHN